MDAYWSRLLRERTNRRRLLAKSAATTVGAALFVACGSDRNNSSGPASGAAKKDSSGLVSAPEDTSKSAKLGGLFKWYNTTEPLHLDGIAQGQAQLNIFNGMVYSSLVANKVGYMEPSSFTEVVPNMAESWEFSPDRTQITFKLRQGVKWQNRTPVNERDFNSSDVVATWSRYESLPANNRAANSNTVNPNAPIISVTATDPRTVVYKLKEPSSFIMQRLANVVTGELGTIQPREAGQGFDPRTDQIGTGGFILDRWEPSVGLTYKRNPDYWDKNEPRIGTLEVPIIREYATGLAALSAGNVYAFLVRQTDIVATKRQTPALNMYGTLASASNPGTTGFGWLPWGPYQKSPFLDVRVRQALSLSQDRDAYIDTFGNVSAFQKEGLPVETFYYTAMGYVRGITLDPRNTKDFGPNAKYYTQDIAEAKKLMAAAGYGNGIDVPSYYVNSGQFASNYENEVQVLDGWARDVGFRPTARGIDYNLEYLPKFITQRGKHDGWLYRAGAVSSPDPVDFFVWRYWSKAGPTSGALGFDVNGNGDDSGDSEVDAMIEKAKAEIDVKMQTVLLQDLQRYLAKMQYCVSRPGVASGFELAWPAAGNFRVFQGDSRAINGHYYTTWVDDTKAPIKKA